MASSFQSALTRARKKRPARFAPSLPPLGSYDPSLLLQYGANKRGADNAQSQYDLGKAQAQDDFAIQTGRLGKQSEHLAEDHATAIDTLHHNYGDLASRQAEGALKANVESSGLLAQALARRKANLTADQKPLDTAFQRGNEDIGDRGADLSLALARAYGSGTGGNPLGVNTLNLTQTKGDALAGNLDLSGVAYQQAASNGFRFKPRRKKRTVIV